MGTYDNHPGGGYQEQKGYVPPAGTMADEQRRQREADAQRAQQEAQRNQQEAFQAQMRDRASVDRQIEERRASTKQGSKRQGSPGRGQPDRAGGSTSGGSKSSWWTPNKTSTPASRPVAQRAWHPFFGCVGFLATTLVVGNKMTGENRWILAAAIGLFAGAVIGRLWKPMLVLGAVGLGLWMWGKAPKKSGPSVAAPTGSSSWIEPSPRPVEVGVVKPDYVPAVIPGDPPRPASSSVLADHPRTPPKYASYRVDTLVLKPGESFVKASRFEGAPVIIIHHTPPLGYEVITQVEYVPATGYVWAHLTDGKAYGLGFEVPVEERGLWMEAEYVGFVQEDPKVSHEMRSIPLTRAER